MGRTISGDWIGWYIAAQLENSDSAQNSPSELLIVALPSLQVLGKGFNSRNQQFLTTALKLITGTFAGLYFLAITHVGFRPRTCLGRGVQNPRHILLMPFSESKHGIDSNTYPPRSAASDLSLLKKDYLNRLMLKFKECIDNPIQFALWASKRCWFIGLPTSFQTPLSLSLSLSISLL
ncbi:hypothetical protein BT93_G0110 [Corymbia citriodora subsp. variegata]|nr:hypothetical protein BT93_G0110 [Corymbia citriodora subsp. variegata]